MGHEGLSIDHQLLIEEKLARIGDGLSEYCFANLYLFRNVHKYRIIYDEQLFISGKTYDGFSFLMPTFDLKELKTEYALKMISNYDFFFPISEPMSRCFDKEVFSIMYNADDSDYVYTAEKLKSYKGRQFSAKRNLVKQFLENFAPRSFSLTGKRLADAENILNKWLSDVGKAAAETDFIPCRNAIHNLDRLALKGRIYYADDEPAGFLIYSEVSPGMCVFHFAKGKRKFKGIFQYMFKHFAKTAPYQFSHYNFEQDLGKRNFRQAKLSYNPDLMLNKYRVKPIIS